MNSLVPRRSSIQFYYDGALMTESKSDRLRVGQFETRFHAAERNAER